ADWLFTTPTVIVQPATGFALVRLSGMPVASRWLAWSIGLYALAIACWLPVVWLQVRLSALARDSDDAHAALPPAYWRFFAWWIGLGVIAFFAFVAIFWFMVTKIA
ncbi:DUF2269 domain-containing protein, partial [Paraburkholderia sp.]|uniref:DUF2269 family protein n=1 Tax=Paraburkholderia sp. TaxID=1926495 RepID=UPI002F3E6B17